MFTVTTRSTLPVEGSAVQRVNATVAKYRHVALGEPALNCFATPMTSDAVLNFNDMLRHPAMSRVRIDERLACTITYAIEEDWK